MKGCLAFRKNIFDLTTKHDDKDFENGIDPFCVSVTIASLFHFIFRKQMFEKRRNCYFTTKWLLQVSKS
jgi:hypothetical protein